VKMGWSCLDGRCVDEKKKEGRDVGRESFCMIEVEGALGCVDIILLVLQGSNQM
jgi:hypothetical protein